MGVVAQHRAAREAASPRATAAAAPSGLASAAEGLLGEAAASGASGRVPTAVPTTERFPDSPRFDQAP